MSEHTEAQQAIREAAWQEALDLYSKCEEAANRARGGAGGGGYRDPHALAEAKRLRTLLSAVIAEHHFQNTRVDPAGLSWAERQSASWECPPISAEVGR